MNSIVVGVDGSQGALRALRWAAREARLRGAALRPVTAFAFEEAVGVAGARWPVETYADIQHRAKLVQEAALEQAADDLAGVAVDPQVVFGPAARVLLDAATGSDLLVVGSRGRGGFTGLLLGSVSGQCVTHAPCPVVVVPGGHDRAGRHGG